MQTYGKWNCNLPKPSRITTKNLGLTKAKPVLAATLAWPIENLASSVIKVSSAILSKGLAVFTINIVSYRNRLVCRNLRSIALEIFRIDDGVRVWIKEYRHGVSLMARSINHPMQIGLYANSFGCEPLLPLRLLTPLH